MPSHNKRTNKKNGGGGSSGDGKNTSSSSSTPSDPGQSGDSPEHGSTPPSGGKSGKNSGVGYRKDPPTVPSSAKPHIITATPAGTDSPDTKQGNASVPPVGPTFTNPPQPNIPHRDIKAETPSVPANPVDSAPPPPLPTNLPSGISTTAPVSGGSSDLPSTGLPDQVQPIRVISDNPNAAVAATIAATTLRADYDPMVTSAALPPELSLTMSTRSPATGEFHHYPGIKVLPLFGRSLKPLVLKQRPVPRFPFIMLNGTPHLLPSSHLATMGPVPLPLTKFDIDHFPREFVDCISGVIFALIALIPMNNSHYYHVGATSCLNPNEYGIIEAGDVDYTHVPQKGIDIPSDPGIPDGGDYKTNGLGGVLINISSDIADSFCGRVSRQDQAPFVPIGPQPFASQPGNRTLYVCHPSYLADLIAGCNARRQLVSATPNFGTDWYDDYGVPYTNPQDLVKDQRSGDSRCKMSYGTQNFQVGPDHWTSRDPAYTPILKLAVTSTIHLPEMGTRNDPVVSLAGMGNPREPDPMEAFSTSGSESNVFTTKRMDYFVNGAGTSLIFKYREDLWAGSIIQIAAFLKHFDCREPIFAATTLEDLCSVVCDKAGVINDPNPITSFRAAAPPVVWDVNDTTRAIHRLMHHAISTPYGLYEVHAGLTRYTQRRRFVRVPDAFIVATNGVVSLRGSSRAFTLATMSAFRAAFYDGFLAALKAFMNIAGRRTIQPNSLPFHSPIIGACEFMFWIKTIETAEKHLHCFPAGGYDGVLDYVTFTENPLSLIIYGTMAGTDQIGNVRCTFPGIRVPSYLEGLGTLSDLWSLEVFLKCVYFVRAFLPSTANVDSDWWRASYLLFRCFVGVEKTPLQFLKPTVSSVCEQLPYVDHLAVIPTDLTIFHEVYHRVSALILANAPVYPDLRFVFSRLGKVPTVMLSRADRLLITSEMFDWGRFPNHQYFTPLITGPQISLVPAALLSGIANKKSGTFELGMLPPLLSSKIGGTGRVSRSNGRDYSLGVPVWVDPPIILTGAALTTQTVINSVPQVTIGRDEMTNTYRFKTASFTPLIAPSNAVYPPQVSSSQVPADLGGPLACVCPVDIAIAAPNIRVTLSDYTRTIFNRSFPNGLLCASYYVGIAHETFVLPPVSPLSELRVFS